MKQYLIDHETKIADILKKNDKSTNWNELKNFHLIQIQFLQHERLIHLMVTLSFALFDLLMIFFAFQLENLQFLIPALLLTIMLFPYLFHYMDLENGVQRLYKQYLEIEKKCKNYE